MPKPTVSNLFNALVDGNRRALARAITIVENSLQGADELLAALRNTDQTKVIGVTGPPGAGKSTLVNELIKRWVVQDKKIAVIAVDPSSPFHFGALLGDRIRMNAFYSYPEVYIRSLASRGALGGLQGKIYEITDLIKEAGFDIILVETVGVGQSEVDIAGIADCTLVVLVPEAGDTIQTMKAGLLEIADVLVVNKSDREGAEAMYRNLRIMAHEQAKDGMETPVLKTTSQDGAGLDELAAQLLLLLEQPVQDQTRRQQMELQKLWQLVSAKKMARLTKTALTLNLQEAKTRSDFNIYSLATQIASNEN